MKIRFKLLTPVSTGYPNYDICKQSLTSLPLSHTSLKLTLNGIVILNEPDITSTFTTIPSLPFIAGNRTLNTLTKSFNYFLIGIDQANLDGSYATLKVEISSPGYISYTNTFNLYDYDLGNATLSTNYNPNFDFVLINKSNNLDINGLQTKTTSNFTAYRKPFTNQIEVYNMVSSQGYYTYLNNTLNDKTISNAQNCILCYDTGLDITQIINVTDIYGNLQDTCSTLITVGNSNWFPTIETIVNCLPTCNEECVSSLATGTYTTTVDADNLTTFYSDDIKVYPYYNSTASIFYRFYDYQGTLIFKRYLSNTVLGLTDPASYIINTFTNTLPLFPPLGDITMTITFIDNNGNDFGDFNPDVFIAKCNKTIVIPVCNWYNIEETDICGIYKINNCSVVDTTLTVKQLQDDLTFTTISITPIIALTSLTISLQTDGVYTFEVPSKDDPTIPQILVIVTDCNFKACLFNYLNTLICSKENSSCNSSCETYYNFNSLILNAHTYFALLNEEYNFNYIYTALDTNKINNLSTISNYLKELSTYCETSCESCKCD